MAAAANRDRAANSDDRVLVIDRIFDAPRELVWRAWTDLEHARKWGGPRDYPMVHIEGELRPGGRWRACLRAVNGGQELWQGGVWREIVAPERLVYTFAWEDESGIAEGETLITIVFADMGGKTKMTFRQEMFPTVESRNGHHGGWTSAFDRLEEHLGTL